jgi:hypothetical protein
MATNENAPEGTYSASPFISKDGVDNDGVRAEVKVVLGLGLVHAITPSDKGKSEKVEFIVHNTKYIPSGWTRDPDVQKKVAQAKQNGELIHFRLETRRQAQVDRKLTMDEIAPKGDMNAARDNVVKSLAAVKLEDDENWTISKDAVTRLDEDPSTSGDLHSAYAMTEEQRNADKPAAATRASSSNGYEPAPYVGRLSNGSVNPGTVAILAPLGFFNYLLEYEREEGVQIDKDRRKEIAHTLFLIANKLQLDIYSKKLGVELKNGNDLTAGSHTRARALIFESIRAFAPITDELLESEELYKAWQKKIYGAAYAMWEWAIDEVDAYIS